MKSTGKNGSQMKMWRIICDYSAVNKINIVVFYYNFLYFNTFCIFKTMAFVREIFFFTVLYKSGNYNNPVYKIA